MDDRGLSAVLGYVLTLAIMTLLVSGLFFAAGNFVENQHERAIRAELEVVGNRLAADIAAVDRMALASSASGRAELRSDLPRLAAGSSYQIETSSTVDPNVFLLNISTSEPAVSVTIEVRTATTLAEGTTNSGDVRIVYDGTELEVNNA